MMLLSGLKIHHLSEYMDISLPAEYFIACYTVLMRPNKVEQLSTVAFVGFRLDSIMSLSR